MSARFRFHFVAPCGAVVCVNAGDMAEALVLTNNKALNDRLRPERGGEYTTVHLPAEVLGELGPEHLGWIDDLGEDGTSYTVYDCAGKAPSLRSQDREAAAARITAHPFHRLRATRFDHMPASVEALLWPRARGLRKSRRLLRSLLDEYAKSGDAQAVCVSEYLKQVIDSDKREWTVEHVLVCARELGLQALLIADRAENPAGTPADRTARLCEVVTQEASR